MGDKFLLEAGGLKTQWGDEMHSTGSPTVESVGMRGGSTSNMGIRGITPAKIEIISPSVLLYSEAQALRFPGHQISWVSELIE